RERVALLARLLPRQVLLRERRAVVRRVGLPRDHQDRPLGSLLPERPRTVPARDPATHYQELDRALRHLRYAAAAPPSGAVNRSLTLSSSPVSSTTSTSSPACTTESASGTNPVPSRRIEIASDPSGH